ncbi:S8 family serine peptidase [Nonomuraea sp. NPDC050404]|uniref:S8 family serine peptidase n=1 Tax=Nonomuraea sp. NPDC050404 TaxID=3155783 RepID=UPI0033C15456
MSTSVPSRPLPSLVYAQVSPKSRGGRSLFEYDSITADSSLAIVSEPQVITDTVNQLRRMGFQILQVSDTTINIAGAPDLYQDVFDCRLTTEPHALRPEQRDGDDGKFVECLHARRPGLIEIASTSSDLDLIEGVAIEEPRLLFESAFPPSVGYWHLSVPDRVRTGCNADLAHRNAYDGRGVRVAMVDTGFYDHAFFRHRHYPVAPVVLGPGAARPEEDEVGHGTAMAANLFSIAPRAELTMVKMSHVNTTAAFNVAASGSYDIISCGWGGDKKSGVLSGADSVLASAIARATGKNTVVVFAAGNGDFGFPAQHPDVISVGGAYLDEQGAVQASDYASGFESKIYPGRRVPDLAGLVGLMPRAAYLMLPVPPGSRIDRERHHGGAAPPDGDGTAPDDGWAVLGGTSAAAPQVAGACALLKQVYSPMLPSEVKRFLTDHARNVAQGQGHDRKGMNNLAMQDRPDLATGGGLLDAGQSTAAAAYAYKSIRF